MDGEKEVVSIKRNRLYYGALAIAVLNPIFSGLILGVIMLREPELKNEGRIVMLFSIVWGVIAILVAAKYGLLAVGK
ncbi:MAG: hypothetical protein HY471_01510 [Candidatus Sungbacteria bacterium]|nr:hypothetical protein [Candidatus Sungbacteria bacterium]